MNRAAPSGGSTRAAGGPSQEPPTQAEPDHRRTLSAQGRRGLVRFVLQRVTGGLYVERDEIPTRGLRVIQSIAFSNADAFDRWCDDDPVRFDHPLLHTQLKRDAAALWRSLAEPGCS